MAHGRQSELIERDPFHLAVCRMIVDALRILAPAIARVEDGGMAVGNAGEPVQFAPGKGAQTIELRFQYGQQVFRQVELQQPPKSRVRTPKVDAMGIRHRLAAVRHGGLQSA